MSLESPRATILGTLLIAAFAGAVIGTGSLMVSPLGRSDTLAASRRIAAPLGLARARPPQPGDQWGGCNDARRAGTAPIYRGEPGYSETMDGDGDGVACEPH